MADSRARLWTFIIYPDSAPENWRSVLDDIHIPWIESPLHDKDTNADGEAKKPHIHILLIFSGQKSFDQIKDITISVNSPIPQVCHDARSLTRYFAHLDNPEKWQYSTDDIIGHGGADVAEYLELLKSRVSFVLQEIFNWLSENHITEYSDLIDYAMATNNTDWFKVATQYATLPIKTYLSSVRHGRRS